MSALAETYLRQARSFLLAGEPERSVELLKKAKAMCAKEPHLMVTVLQDLCNACKLAGRVEEAGSYYLQLQAMLGPAENPPPLPARSRRGRPGAWALVAASILMVGMVPMMWWLLRGRNSTPTPITRENLVRSNVGMVVVIGQYSGKYDGKQYNWDVALATGSCFPIRSDGYLLTNRHVVVDGGSTAPTTLAVRGLPWLNFVRVTYVACFGPAAADHLPAELCGTSSRLDLAVLHVQRIFADPFVLSEQAPHQGDDIFAAGYPGAVQDFVTERNLTPARFQELLGKSAQAGYLNDLELLYDQEAFTPQLDGGIVSVARREIGGVLHVQFDAPTGHGNSGGPLLDAHNRVTGMVTLGLPDAEGKGNNWAISAEELRRELQSLPPVTVSSESADKAEQEHPSQPFTLLGPSELLSAHNMKEILIACIIYAGNHNGEFPPDLATLLNEKVLDPNVLKDPLDPQQKLGYVYVSPPADWRVGQEGEATLPILYEQWSAGYNVAYADGHVEWFGTREEVERQFRDTEQAQRRLAVLRRSQR